jgi:hypothetical protein
MYDENNYYIIRSFKNLIDRKKMENAFYCNDDWQKVLGMIIPTLIENIATIVISVETFKRCPEIIKK